MDLKEVYHIVLDLLVYAAIGSLASWFYFFYRRRALLGGFWGGMLIGFIGAVIIALIATFNDWFTTLLVWLMVPKINGDFHFRVNILAASLGAFLFVYILNRINHDRERA